MHTRIIMRMEITTTTAPIESSPRDLLTLADEFERMAKDLLQFGDQGALVINQRLQIARAAQPETQRTG